MNICNYSPIRDFPDTNGVNARFKLLFAEVCFLKSTGTGTVSSVGFTGGLISVATPTTTPAFTVAGTSGGIPYFSSASTWASSALLVANSILIGGGAGIAPSSSTASGAVATLGGGANAAELRFLEPSASGTNYSAFKAIAQASNITYSLPPAVVAGGVLTDVAGNGTLTWVAPTTGTASITLTNSFITATSIIYVNPNGNGSNLTLINAYIKSQTAGSCVINIQNLSLLSLFNTSFIIDYLIIN